MSVTSVGGGTVWWVPIFYPYTSTLLLDGISQKYNIDNFELPDRSQQELSIVFHYNLINNELYTLE